MPDIWISSGMGVFCLVVIVGGLVQLLIALVGGGK